MTTLLFRTDAYLARCSARVTALVDGRVMLDQTVFYPTGGGQPGDIGTLRRSNGRALTVQGATYSDPEKTAVAHHLAAGAEHPEIGEAIEVALDFARRLRHMRMHTALHLLSVVLPYPVTGGSIGADESRLDFDIADSGLDRDAIAAKVNALIARDAVVTERWISEAELDANPHLVKTMSVKPPRGDGRVRLVEIDGLDLQPCGGTHVRRTSEIGPITVTGIEKKGRLNRRVRIALSD